MTLPLPPVTELSLARFEKVNDVKLPKSYRRFLVEKNGGRPKDGIFPVPGWGVTGIDFFFGIGVGGCYDLQKQFDRQDNPRKSELLPIATDPGGWWVYLSIRGPFAGRVYFWDHKAPESELILIADDFDSFVASLKPDGAYDDYEFGLPPKV